MIIFITCGQSLNYTGYKPTNKMQLPVCLSSHPVTLTVLTDQGHTKWYNSVELSGGYYRANLERSDPENLRVKPTFRFLLHPVGQALTITGVLNADTFNIMQQSTVSL